DGVKHSSKVIVEAIDEEKLVRFKNIEGSLLEEYKSFISTMQVINKGEITTVKWTLEFEKLDDYGPYPTKVMDFVIGMTRDVEAHHLNEKEN
ncbi:Kirola, partial [Bienertia sinuspersici]